MAETLATTNPTEPDTVHAQQPDAVEAVDAAPAPGDLMSAGRRFRLVLLLGLLTALGPLTIDMYLPALPTITVDLAASAAAVQLTLTGTLLGIAVGQLIVGPLADALGRRVPLLAGIGVHVIASVLCVFAPNLAVLGSLRVLQGLGAAAASVVAMAVVRDLFSGQAAARLFSRLMLVIGVAPILAPSIGGLVLRLTEWRGVFVVLGAAGLGIMAATAIALPESLPAERRRRGGVAGTVRDYGRLFADRVYVGLVLVAGLAMAALIAYVSGSSFVFQDEFGLTQQQFAFVFAGGAVGLIGASQVNVRLLRRWTPQRILAGSLVVGVAAAAALLVLAATHVGGLTGVLIPLWTVMAMVGLSMPNVPAIALGRHGEAAGTAAALLGAAQFGGGAAIAPLVGLLGTDAVAMSIAILGGMTAAALTLWLVVRPGRL